MKAISHLRRLTALALLTLAMNTQAQNPASPTDQRIRPMNTETPSVTAFFYQKPEVLDREKHKALRIKNADARFAAKNPSVPLVAAEFAEACLEYPIVFTKGNDGGWMAMALTGLQADTNAFVDTQGLWRARYVPASVRRYPFILAEGGKDQLSLAVDMAAPHIGKEGEAIFDDKGEPTEFVKKIMPLLADFQQQALLTSQLLKQLDEAGLLTQQNLQVRLGDERGAVVEGVWIVDEAKFRQLPDDKVLAWFKNGALMAIQAQLLSLRNLVPLLERSQSATATPNAPKASKKADSRKGKSGG